MRLPDGTTLMHAGQPYDPAKAHDYYLRTRKLKGRKKGATSPTGGKAAPGAVGGKPVRKKKSDPAEIAKLKAHTAARVAVLKKKLHELQTELKKRMAEAEKSAKKADKKPTAADKHAQARDAKKYRDKHKQELKTKAKAASSGGGSSKSKAKGQQEGIDNLKKTIDDVRTKLTAAVARQRALG